MNKSITEYNQILLFTVGKTQGSFGKTLRHFASFCLDVHQKWINPLDLDAFALGQQLHTARIRIIFSPGNQGQFEKQRTHYSCDFLDFHLHSSSYQHSQLDGQ